MSNHHQRFSFRRSNWVLCLLSLALCVPACGSDSSNGNADSSTLKFMWIPKELNNAVFWTGRTGAVKRASEITSAGTRDTEIIYTGTETASDVAGQAKVLLTAKEQGASAVAISCNSGDGLKDAIDSVTRDGIPVMTFDSDSPASSRFTYLGVDNEEGGKIAARILGKSMGSSPRKKVALVSGVQGAANLEARSKGFRTALAQDFPDLEILDPVYCNDDGNVAATLIERIVADHSDVGGFFFVGLWPFFACQDTDCTMNMPLWSAAAAAGDIKTVAFDTLDFELKFITKGLVSGLVGQKYWGWGYDAVQMLYDHVVDNKSFPAWTDSGIDVVCPNNVEEMAGMWVNMDFTSPLTPCKIDGVTIE